MLDPDLPGQGKYLPLNTDFPGKHRWSSTTLKIDHRSGNSTATLTPGKHTVTLSDLAGRSTTHSIIVEEL
jgi:hypothetical protein